MTIRSVLERLDKAGTTLETVVLVSILSAMMVLAVGQIVMREGFGTGFGWADAMVGSIAACRENRHIRIDALSHVLPDAAINVLRILVDLFASVVCAIIAVQAWRYLQVEIEYEDTVLVDTPAWIAHAIMPAAFALIAYRFLVSSLKQAGESLFFGKPGADA